MKAKVKVEPERTCIGCRQKRQKNKLVRISNDKIIKISINCNEITGGRGAYICYDKECIANAFRKGSINRALRIALSDKDVRQMLDKLYEIIKNSKKN